MTAQISAYGRLVADPNTRTTGKGTNMAMARLAVSLPCNAAEDGQATFWLGVIAFGKQADSLAQHVKGDMVSVSGTMQLNQWTGQDGGTQQGYQVLADSVISARTTRPGGRGKSKAGEQLTPQQAHQQPDPQQGSQAQSWEVYRSQGDFDQTPPFNDDF